MPFDCARHSGEISRFSDSPDQDEFAGRLSSPLVLLLTGSNRADAPAADRVGRAPRGGLFAPVSSYVGCDSDLLGTIRRGLQWEVIEPPLWRDSKESVDEK